MSEVEKKDSMASTVKFFEEIKELSDSGIAILNPEKNPEIDAQQLFDVTVKIQDAVEEIRDLIFQLED